MSKTNTLKITAEEAGARLDVFLSAKLKISRSQVQKMIAAGEILVNAKLPKKAGDTIKTGQTIEYGLAAAKSKEAVKKDKAADTKMTGKLKIISENKDFLVVEKPAGLLTHSTVADERHSLSKILLKKYPGLKKVGDSPDRPGIVHRLDKEASGLLVVARNQKMFDYLKEQFKNRAVDKEYLVLVHDKVEADTGTIDFPLARSKSKDRMSALPKTKYGVLQGIGKEALTEFWVEKRFINFSLLLVKIYTGRMHQIRVHLLAYDHPVVGDPLYFQKKIKRAWDEKCGRLFLHCTKLSFIDLKGNKQNFESPLPKELAEFLKLLR